MIFLQIIKFKLIKFTDMFYKCLFFFIGAFLTNSIFSQYLKMDELLLLQKNNLTYAENYLLKKNWDLHRTDVSNADYFGDLFTDYSIIVWSYNKNRWDDKAEAWFYLYYYSKLENVVTYQMHDKDRFTQFKTYMQNSTSYKLIRTEAVDRGLETRYRDSKMEIILKQYYKGDEEDDDYYSDSRYSNVHYLITIFNYKEVEQLIKAAQEREQREYEEQLRLKREKQIKEEQYQSYIKQAENHMYYRNYIQAKESYKNALELKTEEKTYIQNKISEIDKMLQFLNERKSVVYNYSTDFPSDYKTTNDRIEVEIKNVLLDEKTVNNAKFTITSVIDTAGIVSNSFVSTVNNPVLERKLKQIADNVKPKQPMMNGYTVSAKAVFDYSLDVDETIVKVKKNAKDLNSNDEGFNTYYSEITNTLSSAPMGKFTLKYNRVTMNGTKYTQDKILKYSGTGGPSNVFKSLLIPGMGKRSVTGGVKSGVGTAIFTYTFIGTGIGLKFYSNSEYSNYHAVTEQSIMDKHYENANIANQAFYVCIATGAIIWISDIIYVWSKGKDNKNKQQAWKRANLSFYCSPELEVKGLTCTINF